MREPALAEREWIRARPAMLGDRSKSRVRRKHLTGMPSGERHVGVAGEAAKLVVRAGRADLRDRDGFTRTLPMAKGAT